VEDKELTPLKVLEMTIGPQGEIPKLREELKLLNKAVSAFKQMMENGITEKINNHEDRLLELEKDCGMRRATDTAKVIAVEEYQKKLREEKEKGREEEHDRMAKEDRIFLRKAKTTGYVIAFIGVMVAIIRLILIVGG